MKPTLFVLALTVSLVTGSAFARIGETPAECTARYGEPISIDKEKQILSYMKSGMVIMAYFHEGKCDMLVLTKVERDIIGNGVEISENEIELLLSANAGDRQWKERPLFSLDKEWETEDGAVLAQYTSPNPMLMICTREYNERQKAAKKAEEQKKLNGF